MAEKRYNLSEKDRDLLNRALSKVAHTRLTASGRPRDDAQIDLAQELLIAKAPDGGVPALVSSGSGSGTGSTTDEPGVANCQLYQVVVTEIFGADTAYPGTHISSEIREVLMAPVTVFNWTSAAIASGTYFVVARDRFGTWLVVPQAAAGLSVVKITNASPTGLNYSLKLQSLVSSAWVDGADVVGPDLDGALALTVGDRYIAVHESADDVWVFRSHRIETGVLTLVVGSAYSDNSYDCTVVQTLRNSSFSAWAFNLDGGPALTVGDKYLCHLKYPGTGMGGPTYIAISSNTNSQPPTSNWIIYLGNTGAYSNTTTYSKGQVVSSGGTYYLFINVTPTAGIAPPSAFYWQALPGAPGSSAAWDATTTFAVGDLTQLVRPIFTYRSDSFEGAGWNFTGDVGTAAISAAHNTLTFNAVVNDGGAPTFDPVIYVNPSTRVAKLSIYDAGPFVSHGLISDGAQSISGDKDWLSPARFADTVGIEGLTTIGGTPSVYGIILQVGGASAFGGLLPWGGPSRGGSTISGGMVESDWYVVSRHMFVLPNAGWDGVTDPLSIPNYHEDYSGGIATGTIDLLDTDGNLTLSARWQLQVINFTNPYTVAPLPFDNQQYGFCLVSTGDFPSFCVQGRPGYWSTDGLGNVTTDALGQTICGGLIITPSAAVPVTGGGTGSNLGTTTTPGIVVQAAAGGALTTISVTPSVPAAVYWNGTTFISGIPPVSVGGTGVDLSGTSSAGVIIQSAAGGALSQVSQLPPVLGGLGADNSGASVGDVPTWNGTAYVPGAGSGGGADEGSISSAFGGF